MFFIPRNARQISDDIYGLAGGEIPLRGPGSIMGAMLPTGSFYVPDPDLLGIRQRNYVF